MSDEFKVGDRIITGSNRVGTVTCVERCTSDGKTQAMWLEIRALDGWGGGTVPQGCRKITEEEYTALVMGGA